MMFLFFMLSLPSFAFSFDSYESEETKVESAIDHHFFNTQTLPETKIAYTQTSTLKESSSTYSYENEESKDYVPTMGLGINYRYLGQLNKIGIEKSITRQFSAGLYTGRFQGRYYGTEKEGMISDLQHYALEFNFYLNSAKKAFQTGPLIKFGVHYNRLKSGVDAQQIEVDGEKVIGEGESKFGPLVGAAYFWQWKYVNLTAGAEYFVLGKLKSFVPLSLSLGVAF